MSGSTHRVSVVVDRTRHPKLQAFVEWGIDMQLADIRDLLRLPMSEAGLDSGQNFSTAATLANVIAGASVWFFEASEAGLRNRRDRSRRYREVLRRYWPWNGEVVDVDNGVRVLYDYVRNPLSHSVGRPEPEDSTRMAVDKRPLDEAQLGELDSSTERPAWLGPTIRPAPSGAPDRAYFVSVPGMYWGVQRLLREVLTDEAQLARAEALADVLVRFLTAPNASWRAGAAAEDSHLS